MWTWLAMASLAQVLLASDEVELIPGKSLTESGREAAGDVDSGMEPLSQFKSKPVTTNDLQWAADHVFQDIGGYENAISGLIRELGSTSGEISDDERKKRSTREENVEDAAPTNDGDPATDPASWMSWLTHGNKALPIRDSQDPWQEIKKSRAFSPWGVKRITVFGQGAKVRRPIRVPFNSWGGKRYDKAISRDFSEDEKRARFSSWGGKRTAFNSWGGKRDWEIGTEEMAIENHNGADKRTKFNAWGGKRSKNGDSGDEEVKRTRFNAWGGKRSEIDDKRAADEESAKKRVFNAWGGKRFTLDEISPVGGEVVPYSSTLEKGASGLQTPRELIEAKSLNYLLREEDAEEIPTESKMMGLPERRGGGDHRQRSLFNPWGGKKRSDMEGEEIENIGSILPESSRLRGHHQQERFWPWGG